jgi:hypothetical protein
MRTSTKILVGKPDERRHFRVPLCIWEIYSGKYFKEAGFIGLKIGESGGLL